MAFPDSIVGAGLYEEVDLVKLTICSECSFGPQGSDQSCHLHITRACQSGLDRPCQLVELMMELSMIRSQR